MTLTKEPYLSIFERKVDKVIYSFKTYNSIMPKNQADNLRVSILNGLMDAFEAGRRKGMDSMIRLNTELRQAEDGESE